MHNKVRFPLQVLSDDDIKSIYVAALEILVDVGIQFEDERVLHILEERGCTVDYPRMRVKFIPSVIEQALRSCPSEFTVKARNPEYSLLFDGSHVYFAAHSAPTVCDPKTGLSHKPSSRDVQDRLILIDALEHINATLTLTGEVSDKPPEVGVEWVKAETFRRTAKVTTAPAFRNSPKWIIEMAAVVGSQVIGCCGCSPPLFYAKQDTDAMLQYAAAGHPVTAGSGIALGGTGPVTLAGSLAQQTAETLAGVALVQSCHPGTGMLWLTETAPMDMRIGDLAWGSIEVGMLHAAQGQMSRFLGLQNFSLFPMSSSHISDQQLGFEKGMQAIIMALSGIQFMAGGGGVYNESSICLEQLIIDNDIYGMAARFLEGFEVNADTLALDIIREIGLQRNSYLSHKHTRRMFKQEHFFPGVSNRLAFETWEKSGSKDIVARAQERIPHIIQKHESAPLSPEAERELDTILRAVEKERLSGTQTEHLTEQSTA